MAIGEFSNTSQAVAVSGTTTVATIEIPHAASVMWMQVASAAAGGALDAFALQILTHASGAYETLASSAADFTTGLAHPLLACNGSPVTLAAEGTIAFKMDVSALHSIRITASANTTISTISLYYRFS